MTRPFTTIAVVLFALAVLVHLYRLFAKFQITIGTHSIPMWCSYLAILIAALLAWGLYRESKA